MEIKGSKHESIIAKIIYSTLVELYGINGYKSIIDIMTKECGKQEQDIITDYNLFEEMVEVIFGKTGNNKILEPIKYQISKLNEKEIETEMKRFHKHDKMRLLIAEDDPRILELYRDWLKMAHHDVITATDGQKCLNIYKKEYEYARINNLKKCFDVVILDHIMPNMTGVETASEILKINPDQRIIFASGHVRKILLESVSRINKVIEIIEKPFSIESLDDMINKNTLWMKFDEINSNQNIKTPLEKYSKALNIISQMHHK